MTRECNAIIGERRCSSLVHRRMRPWMHCHSQAVEDVPADSLMIARLLLLNPERPVIPDSVTIR